jgi:hypothetical protein
MCPTASASRSDNQRRVDCGGNTRAATRLAEDRLPRVGALAIHEPQLMSCERKALGAARDLARAGNEREPHEVIGERDRRVGVRPRERAERAPERLDRARLVGSRTRLAGLRVREPGPWPQAPRDARELHAIRREEDLDPVTPQR